MPDHCGQKYSLTCLKLDVVRLLDKLGHTPAYRLLPGIFLVHNNFTLVSTLPKNVMDNVTALDVFLATRVSEYLNSLTLSVKVLDSGTVNTARKLSEHIITGRYSNDLQTGRKKGGGAMWAAGTMAAVGMAALAAVSGKAMMTSMLALMMAAAGALRGSGGGGDSGKCGYSYPAAKRSITIQERPIYRPAITSTYGPATP
ncbi:hypothetical protein J6590_000828 [Homalodisca vitripennis]|nr:hypothetical protein J6590_000828 [Homalodisca vitripennis]